MKNISLSTLLKNARLSKNLSQKDLSRHTGIDNGLLSKYEKGQRDPSKEHISILCNFYSGEGEMILSAWLGDKLQDILLPYSSINAVMMAMEERVQYLRRTGPLTIPVIADTIQQVLVRVESLRNEWVSCKPLDSLQLSKLQEYFKVQYTYDSNRIEGNTLTLKETHLVLQEGVTISGKSLKDHLEAINHSDAIDFMHDIITRKEAFTSRVLMQLHQLILQGVDNKHAGVYRTVPVMISGSKHVPPEPYMIPHLMHEYFDFYEKNRDIIHPVILAAEMHERLVTIHPFIDGNGRVSRLVMNFILLSNGYSVLILKGDTESRLQYYDALEKVQVDGDPAPFHSLIVRHAEESLKQHLSLV